MNNLISNLKVRRRVFHSHQRQIFAMKFIHIWRDRVRHRVREKKYWRDTQNTFSCCCCRSCSRFPPVLQLKMTIGMLGQSPSVESSKLDQLGCRSICQTSHTHTSSRRPPHIYPLCCRSATTKSIWDFHFSATHRAHWRAPHTTTGAQPKLQQQQQREN